MQSDLKFLSLEEIDFEKNDMISMENLMGDTPSGTPPGVGGSHQESTPLAPLVPKSHENITIADIYT